MAYTESRVYKNVMGITSLQLHTHAEVRLNESKNFREYVWVSQLYDVCPDGSLQPRGQEQIGESEVESVLRLCELAWGYHTAEANHNG